VIGSSDPFRSAADRRRVVGLAFLGATALAGGAVVIWRFLPFLADPDWVRSTVAGFGPLAPLVFVALQALQVVFAPIPGQALGGVAGYLFGTWGGFLYSMIGVTIGSTAAFLLARRFGRPFVERTFDPEAIERFDAVADDAGAFALFALFLLPTFPDDVLCALAGVSAMRLRTLLALVVVGRAPSFAVVAYAGDSAAAARPLAALAALAAVALSTAVVYGIRSSRLSGAGGDRAG
jgi:uncharacterized membrane protein YdjX (TVP38/TMEM64 family)